MTDISIVVPVRRAEATIEATLRALLAECQGVAAEVIAAVSSADPTVAVLRKFSSEPNVRLIEMDGEQSVPQLRAAGVRAATGRLVAITEDHCRFSTGWVRGCIEVLDRQQVAAAGGPVENGRTGSALDWAIFFSRYLGWMPPMRRNLVSDLPGNNACYRRDVLEAHRDLFAAGFWEHDVNRELAARGHRLWLEPGLVVTHHKPYRFLPYLALRYRHARCFGAMEGARGGRWVRLLRWPLVGPVLVARAVRTIQRKRRRAGEFRRCFPALLLCYGFWWWGELVGLLAGAGRACSRTD